jgi:hypothetical protein
MRHGVAVTLIASAAITLAVAPVQAELTFYTTRSAWEAAAGSHIVTEDFNAFEPTPYFLVEGINHVGLLDIEMVNLALVNENNSIWPGTSSLNIDGTNFLRANLADFAAEFIHIHLPGPVIAYAGDFVSTHSSAGLVMTIGDTDYLFEDLLPAWPGTGFVGFVSTAPFSQVTFHIPNPFLGESFGHDNISFVPTGDQSSVDDSVYGMLLFPPLFTQDARDLTGNQFNSAAVGINRGANDRFFLSSDGMSFAPLVVDDAVQINTVDSGLGPYEYQPGVPPLILYVAIEENLVPLPAHDITSLIPLGSSGVLFELLDTQGRIFGNTAVYTVRDCGIWLDEDESGQTRVNWLSHDVEIGGFQSNLDVISGTISQLLSDQDYFHACFLGTFLDTTQAVDDRPDPPTGDGYYYLVAGTCASPIGFGDSSLVPDPRDVLPVTYPCP